MIATPTTFAPPQTTSWEALGTTVVLRVRDRSRAAHARLAVEQELAAIDGACSRFREDSELSRLNARAGRPTSVGPVLMEALELALRAAAVSDGDVDPTIGRALELAGYDRDWSQLQPAGGAAGAVPTAPAPRLATRDGAAGGPRLAVRARAGWRRIRLERARSVVTIPRGTRLDLGATAKAWAADRSAAAAARAARCGALVAIGGDIATAGPAPPGGWLIRVTDDHREVRADAPGQTVAIESGGLATSSTTVRRWATDRGHAHHLIDPRTGRPARSEWRTVSVVAGSCADANIATTAAIVRGRPALAWLEDQGLPARLVDVDGRATEIAGWPAP